MIRILEIRGSKLVESVESFSGVDHSISALFLYWSIATLIVEGYLCNLPYFIGRPQKEFSISISWYPGAVYLSQELSLCTVACPRTKLKNPNSNSAAISLLRGTHTVSSVLYFFSAGIKAKKDNNDVF